MLGLGKGEGPKPKCYFTEATLPGFVDQAQPPTKKKPFSTVLAQPFCHTLDIVISDRAAKTFQTKLADGVGSLRYARVHMKPMELIEGAFFNDYIKSGNIAMLSEGRPGTDHILSLSEGILRIEVNKPTYERLGLEGKAIPSEGRKHVKVRYAIELNLRLPSMVHGKKGFERVVWAFKNVLDSSLTWLFYDLKGANDGSGPIGALQPTLKTIEPETERFTMTSVPQFPDAADKEDPLTLVELLEWLTLVHHGSPRVDKSDDVDSYLSRYEVPDKATAATQDLVKFHWYGFCTSTFITKILIAALKASGDDWCSLSAATFSGQTYTILKHQDKTLTWEAID